MNFKKVISLILIISCLVPSVGCLKKVSLIDPQKYWWSNGTTWIKPKNHEQWFKVIKVEADSVYCIIPKGSNTRIPDSLVVFHLSSLEQVKKEEFNSLRTFLTGMVFGGVITFIILGIHISKAFATESH